MPNDPYDLAMPPHGQGTFDAQNDAIRRGRELAERSRLVEASLASAPATRRITQLFGLRAAEVDILPTAHGTGLF